VLFIEVKCGGVQCDPRTKRWTREVGPERKEIKNPFEQAQGAQRAITTRLAQHPLWRRRGLNLQVNRLTGWAVFFPDVVKERGGAILQYPGGDPRIIGWRGDLEENKIRPWLDQALGFWRDQKPDQLGQDGMTIIQEILAPVINLHPLLAHRIEDEEKQRVALTDQQARALDLLCNQKRAKIAGGAGTGKTVLALRQARRFARSGLRALLICHSAPLAQYLVAVCKGEKNLEVLNFNRLCESWIAEAKKQGRDCMNDARGRWPGNADEVVQSVALTLATNAVERRFDAVIVDEGQDFSDRQWLAIETLLKDKDQSRLFVFYDDNQRIFGGRSTIPVIANPAFLLTRNCRNTRHIHRAAYKYYEGNLVDPPEMEGRPVEKIVATTIKEQAQKIFETVRSLLDTERVGASDIVVLIADVGRCGEYTKALAYHTLPQGVIWAIGTAGQPNPGAVLVDTAARFKGLEANVVILWGLDTFSYKQRPELLYEALSRAKSQLYVVGNEETCSDIAQK